MLIISSSHLCTQHEQKKFAQFTACDHASMLGEVTGNDAVACNGHEWVLADMQWQKPSSRLDAVGVVQ